MKELKFRAWDKKQKKMLYGVSIGTIKIWDENAPLISHEFSYSEDCIFEQVTGLKDKNGKEIWVGDIISFSIPHFDKSTGYDGETELVGKIIFNYDRYCIEDKDGISYGLYFAEEGEVIGNIHENGELLGGKE